MCCQHTGETNNENWVEDRLGKSSQREAAEKNRRYLFPSKTECVWTKSRIILLRILYRGS